MVCLWEFKVDDAAAADLAFVGKKIHFYFYSAVRKMREEVAGASDGTPDVGHLSVHPVGTGIRNGAIVDKFQRALTREREDAVFKLPGVTVSNLPASECL